MSIDTLSSRPDATVAPLALAATPSEAPPAVASPTAPVAAALRLQARRLRAVQELAERITRLEQEQQAQARALEKSRLDTRDHLRELQQRSTSLTTELLRGQARTSRLDREHLDARRRLEARVAAEMGELEGALAPLPQALQSLATEFASLQDRQAMLDRLQSHLDRLLLRQGRQLDLMTAEFRQQLDLLRVHQETLQEELGTQQTALLALGLEHEQATLHLERLRSAHENLATRTEARLERLAQQQRVLASLLAALALLSLTLIAWCHTHPVAVAPAARQQLQQLAATTERQDDVAQAQAHLLAGHDLRLAEQQLALDATREQHDRMRLAGLRQQREIAHLRREIAALRAQALPHTPPVEGTVVADNRGARDLTPASTAALH